MTRSIKGILKVALGSFAAVLLAWMLLIYSVAEPDTWLGYSVFRVVYSSPVPKGWFLPRFSNELKEHNGGYIGEPVDEFLCYRLEASDSTEEMAAIINFYALQAGGREGHNITALSDEAKQKLIGFVLDKLDYYEPEQVRRVLFIVEQVRRGEILYKGGFGASDYEKYKQDYNFNYERWWIERGLAETKVKYQEWWISNLPWREKKLINPLENSTVKVYCLD